MSEVWLKPGDIIRNGGRVWVVDMTNDSRARCVPLTATKKVINDVFNGPKEIQKFGDSISISPRIEADALVQRLSGAELNRLCSLKTKRAAAESKRINQPTSAEGNSNMKKAKSDKKQNQKPSKGRSEFIHKLHESKTPKAEALVKTQEKFDCPGGLFDRIWARSMRGAEEAKPKSKKATPPVPKKPEPAAAAA